MNIPQVANFISELLHTTDCVTIPDFGAFVSNEVSAKLDASKHKITPPGPQISFNKNIKNNDGLLANFISTKQGITYAEAVEYVKGLAIEINSELQKTKSFEFGVLGTFYMAPGNILKFEPSPGNPNFDLGLHSMTLTPLANEPWADKHAVGKQIVANDAEATEPIEGKKAIIPWGKIAVAIIALPMGAYLAWMPTQTNMFSKTENFNFSELNPFGKAPVETYHERNNTPAFETAEADELNEQLEAEVPEIKPNKDADVIVDDLTDESVDVIDEPSTETQVTLNFQLIGGCFGDKSNAETLIANLQRNGLDAQIFDYHNGLHRVSLGGYATESEARLALQNLKNNYNTSAWVLKL